jgi:hypothetical protein
LFRIVINKSIRHTEKKKLIDILDKNENYVDKLKIVYAYLKDLLVLYVEYSEGIKLDAYDDFTHLTTCINNTKDTCNMSKCLWNASTCKLLLPKNNLLTSEKNEEVYTARLADELIRNYKKRLYLLEKNQYMVLKELPYKVADDEILILEDQLFNEYLENIKYVTDNKHYNIKNSYHHVLPNNIKKDITYNLQDLLNDGISGKELSEEKVNESKALKEKIRKMRSKKSKSMIVKRKKTSKIKL